MRALAVGALANLACDAANKQPMWADGPARVVLLAGAAAGEAEAVRVLALGALRNLARGAANQQPMWADGPTRAVLLAAAAAARPASSDSTPCIHAGSCAMSASRAMAQ